MLDLSLGDPASAYVFFLCMSGISLLLSAVIVVVVAFPWARRARYRNFGAMPRTGAGCGAGTAMLLIYIAWNSAFAEFYRIEIDREAVRLHYHMPKRITVLPRDTIVGMQRGTTMAKWMRWQIEIVAAGGTRYSTKLERRRMEEAWAALTPFLTPLE